MEKQTNFNRVRDFGEIINDTIHFVKQHFKPLFAPMLYIALVFILAAIATGIVLQVKSIGVMGAGQFGPMADLDSFGFIGYLGVNYTLYLLFYFLSYTVVQLVVLCYILCYRDQGGYPSKEAVWTIFKTHFWRFLLVSFILFIIQLLATLCCILPGIYLFPIISLVYVLVVVDDASLEQAFSRAFSLIKGNWWKTFGVLCIIWLIVSVSVSMLALPGTVLTMSGFLFGESPSVSLTGAIINVVVQSFGMLLYSIPTIAAAFCFFSLSEEKEGTGLMGRIADLGKDEGSTSNERGADEEY